MKVRYVVKETDKVEVRAQLPEDISGDVDDIMMCRYIRAERGNVKAVRACH